MRRLSVLLAAPVLALMLTAAEPPPAPDRPLPDAAQEARARALFADVR
ncbi:cytochrome C biogenesis protein, partial [Rhodospirillum rubrum]|nr:cytochrome C biogenesis protein [Rhodospirillum rubrum]